MWMQRTSSLMIRSLVMAGRSRTHRQMTLLWPKHPLSWKVLIGSRRYQDRRVLGDLRYLPVEERRYPADIHL